MALVWVVRLPDVEGAAIGAVAAYPTVGMPPEVFAEAQSLDGLVVAPGEHAHIVLGSSFWPSAGCRRGCDQL